jgi:hypothetical protein
MLVDELLNLKDRHTHFNTEIFDLLATSHNTAIVITQHRYWLANKIRSKDSLTGYIEIIAINEGEQWFHYKE